MFNNSAKKVVLFGALGALPASLLAGCTAQTKDSFRFAQRLEEFSISQDINTKVDMLWVVDNSASMDVSQAKLRAGFAAFANKYMQPTWDIQAAVITTDTYLANTAFNTWRTSTVSGSVNWSTAYTIAHKAQWSNPSWNATLMNTANGKFTNGIKYQEMVPAWGATGQLYSRLLPGLHDGPISALCTESTPTGYFYGGASQCATRDFSNTNRDTTGCLNPNTGAGESSTTQCVNTVQNDTVHSGKAIIKTLGANSNQLINDFIINVTTGSAGHGSERGLGSMIQMINDNESTATALFRAGSIRVIVFVTDEDDQTMVTGNEAGFNPMSYYKCDLASLQAKNPAAGIGNNASYCCANGTCSYGSEGTSCTSKTIDGYTYTPSICPRTDKLVAVSSIKTQVDNFFKALDGGTTDPNYLVAVITPTTGQAIQDLQALRDAEDTTVGSTHTNSTDRGDRYMDFANAVGNGSLTLNLASSDYTPILTSIGNAIIAKKSTFTLTRAPTGQEDMIVAIIHANGSQTIVTSGQYTVVGTTLTITDINFVLGLAATDKISINYQPRNAG